MNSKTRFLVSRNPDDRLEYIKRIDGKKLIIHGGENPFEKIANWSVNMNKLMDSAYYLESLPKCNADVTLILLDVLVKHGTYCHPYGRIYRFSEAAKTTHVIDTFVFKWNERQIVRPFVFINRNLLPYAITESLDGDFAMEDYVDRIRDYVDIRVEPLDIKLIGYTPTDAEKRGYDELKRDMIADSSNQKNHIVSKLIKYVDALDSKRAAISDYKPASDTLAVLSNNPKAKFSTYQALRDPRIRRVAFFSSGVFGADEIELSKTKDALIRHNELIRRLYAKQGI